MFHWLDPSGINRMDINQAVHDGETVYLVTVRHGTMATVVRLDLDTMAELVRSVVWTEPLRSKLESRF